MVSSCLIKVFLCGRSYYVGFWVVDLSLVGCLGFVILLWSLGPFRCFLFVGCASGVNVLSC